ncbi:hypothetical protein EDB89DRAFT_382666 [Lactarius sanguifluus]|nr:hypothetical protein EDB89DRAFT_382666 [Lactarius sanguifluus]
MLSDPSSDLLFCALCYLLMPCAKSIGQQTCRSLHAARCTSERCSSSVELEVTVPEHVESSVHTTADDCEPLGPE